MLARTGRLWFIVCAQPAWSKFLSLESRLPSQTRRDDRALPDTSVEKSCCGQCLKKLSVVIEDLSCHSCANRYGYSTQSRFKVYLLAILLQCAVHGGLNSVLESAREAPACNLLSLARIRGCQPRSLSLFISMVPATNGFRIALPSH